jgi:hypothetical protein
MKVENLRLLIREKLQDGRLPHERISRVQSRPADGEKCDVCEGRITMAQFVVTGTILVGRGSIQLHVDCFQVWDDERLPAVASPRDIRRRYRACRAVLPAARSMSPGLTISLRQRVERRPAPPSGAPK